MHSNISQDSYGKIPTCLDMRPNKRSKLLIGQRNGVACFCKRCKFLISRRNGVAYFLLKT